MLPVPRPQRSAKDCILAAKRPGSMREQRSSLEVYVRDDVHAGPKLAIPVFAGLENNLYRDSLYYFYVVAGGILRRKQTEEGARGTGDAVHVAFQGLAGRIHMDFRSLSDAHVPELGLFEIGGNPDVIERHHREELLAGLNVQPDDHRFIYFTSDRRNNFGVLEIELGLLEECAFLLYIGNGRAHARLRGGHLSRPGFRVLVIRIRLHRTALSLLHELLRGGLIGTGCHYCGGTGFSYGQGLIVNLLGDFLFVDQKLVTAKILLRLYVV